MPSEESDVRVTVARARDSAGEERAALSDARFRDRPLTDFEDLIDIEIGADEVERILEQRKAAAAQVYTTLDVIRRDMVEFFPKVPEVLPQAVDGRLFNPDGRPAQQVWVEALEPAADDAPAAPWPRSRTLTDARGAFRLSLPSRPVPDDGLALRVTGSDQSIEMRVRRAELVSGTGALGALPLDVAISPVPRSVLAQLSDVVVPTSPDDVVEHPEEFADPAPVVTLGEGDCAHSFRSNAGVIDRFGFSLLVRLVAPQLSGRQLATRLRGDDTGSFFLSPSAMGLSKYISAGDLVNVLGQLGRWELVERVPVEEPIDVDRFRDTIQRNPKAVPKASSLGLGYTVRMHQIWIPAGLSLGDLVYSLPLAPGEQQRIAISDERETLSVREAESLSAEEFQRYSESADSSTSAVFSSAFDEAASGGSRMSTRTEAGAIGGGLGVGGFFSGIVAGLGVAGGYSDSSTTGSTSSWQNASRDYVSNATQDFHSHLSRQAAARRRANRTSVRLASAAERQEIVTKVITNHNHCHALTMQYWQVLRHYALSTKVDDVQLVCFVPLEVVQFLPRNQPLALPEGTYSRNQLLQRYGALVQYHDVLERRLWWRPELMHGLRTLRAFAGNPTMVPEASSGSAQDIISVSLTGTFMPFEDVYVTAISTTGARVGPVRMHPASSAPIPTGLESRGDLLEKLRVRRRDEFQKRTADLALPQHVARSDLARLEFSRRFSTFSYRLSLPSDLDFGDFLSFVKNTAQLDVTLTPADLERELGGPVVTDPVAQLGGTDVIEYYHGPGGTERMGAVLPVPAKRLPPVLRFADLLRIEAVLQHVVSNTVTYSRAIWESLTAEERAILLERYTIGVPTGGITDATQDVPLLNCVANEVLGYFGNAAIMPFFIPPTVARDIGRTSRDIQEALLKFHRQAFVPPQSSITLPARGVLGEAVLGSCNACEKIDLTRFWNWQDSPADTATDPKDLAQLFGDVNSLVGPAGATAPSQLALAPMVTINQGAAAFSPADLAKALIDKMPASNLPQNLTGLAELAGQMKVQTETTAESLNKTISEASGLAKAAMEALPKAMEAKAKTEPKASGGEGAGAGDGASGGGGTPADGGGAPPPPNP